MNTPLTPTNLSRRDATRRAVDDLFQRIENLGFKEEDSRELDLSDIRIHLQPVDAGDGGIRHQAEARARITLNVYGVSNRF